MSGRDTQAVLRCIQCNKPFDKQSTLKRHGYYCRSRKVGSTNRARSCISCAKGKARCDNKRPGCSRCASKGIQCHYPANSRKDPEPRAHNDDMSTATGHQRMVSNSPVGARQEASHDDDIRFDSGFDSGLDMPLDDFRADLLNWNDPEVDFTDFLNPQTLIENVDYASSEESLVRRSTPPSYQLTLAQQVAQHNFISLPPTPSTYNARSLILRTKAHTGAARSAGLILSTLKSYPKIMLHEKVVPPFIHPRLVPSDGTCDQMEPLSNCISLVHMLSSGLASSKKLFWKNVRMECERIRAECLDMTKWSLLAAMQALSIYILIRLCEGETEHNNFDVLLLGTVAIVAKQMICTDVEWTTPSALSTYGLEFSWKEWLFEESRRRLSVVFRVVDMLVHFEPASLCEMQKDLLLAPLPARKQLWEAPDAYAWKMASEKDAGSETAFALASNGELVKLEDPHAYCTGSAKLRYKSLVNEPSRKTALWEEWCAGMDGFGGLVMLAASLVE